jgi:3D (Asp-Asp-Asp) domain-containing protein
MGYIGQASSDENGGIVKKSLGTFNLTAYCPCEICCGKSDGVTASGVKATADHTIAVDTSVIPLGSKVEINGKIYTATDTSGHKRCRVAFSR